MECTTDEGEQCLVLQVENAERIPILHIISFRPGVAKVLARGPEVAREPVFGGPRKVIQM